MLPKRGLLRAGSDRLDWPSKRVRTSKRVTMSMALESFHHSPSVAFRAARKYVHSTTLYEELLAGAKAAGLDVDGPIELTVRRKMTTQPEFHYSAAPADIAADAPATFSLQAEGVRWHGVVCGRNEP